MSAFLSLTVYYTQTYLCLQCLAPGCNRYVFRCPLCAMLTVDKLATSVINVEPISLDHYDLQIFEQQSQHIIVHVSYSETYNRQKKYMYGFKDSTRGLFLTTHVVVQSLYNNIEEALAKSKNAAPMKQGYFMNQIHEYISSSELPSFCAGPHIYSVISSRILVFHNDG